MTINLNQLPPPQVVEELDFETILTQRKAKLLEIYPEVADVIELESEPMNYLLQENAYREVVWRQRVNEAAKATMLAFAEKADLDHVAATKDTERLEIEPADPTANPPKSAVMEDDESLRMRTQEAPERMAVAGPRNQYQSIARASDGRVADAYAESPVGAEVVLTVLSREGNGIPDQELLDIVDAALQPEDVRPVADRVTVQAADVAEYIIDAVLHLPPGPESAAILEIAQQRLDAYTSERKLGKSIRRTAITSALHVPGVTHVELISPAADIIRTGSQAGYCTGETLATQVDNG